MCTSVPVTSRREAMLLGRSGSPRRQQVMRGDIEHPGHQDFDRRGCRLLPHLRAWMAVPPAALPVRAEEVDQDRGDYLRRGL